MPRELPTTVIEAVRVLREARKAERTARETSAKLSDEFRAALGLDYVLALARATLAVSDTERALDVACREAMMGSREFRALVVEAGRDDSLH